MLHRVPRGFHSANPLLSRHSLLTHLILYNKCQAESIPKQKFISKTNCLDIQAPTALS